MLRQFTGTSRRAALSPFGPRLADTFAIDGHGGLCCRHETENHTAANATASRATIVAALRALFMAFPWSVRGVPVTMMDRWGFRVG